MVESVFDLLWQDRWSVVHGLGFSSHPKPLGGKIPLENFLHSLNYHLRCLYHQNHHCEYLGLRRRLECWDRLIQYPVIQKYSYFFLDLFLSDKIQHCQ